MVFRGLPHRKWFLDSGHKENGFYDVAIKEMVSRGLPQRKWFLGACHTENCLEQLSTWKIVVKRLLHGKEF